VVAGRGRRANPSPSTEAHFANSLAAMECSFCRIYFSTRPPNICARFLAGLVIFSRINEHLQTGLGAASSMVAQSHCAACCKSQDWSELPASSPTRLLSDESIRILGNHGEIARLTADAFQTPQSATTSSKSLGSDPMALQHNRPYGLQSCNIGEFCVREGSSAIYRVRSTDESHQ